MKTQKKSSFWLVALLALVFSGAASAATISVTVQAKTDQLAYDAIDLVKMIVTDQINVTEYDTGGDALGDNDVKFEVDHQGRSSLSSSTFAYISPSMVVRSLENGEHPCAVSPRFCSDIIYAFGEFSDVTDGIVNLVNIDNPMSNGQMPFELVGFWWGAQAASGYGLDDGFFETKRGAGENDTELHTVFGFFQNDFGIPVVDLGYAVSDQAELNQTAIVKSLGAKFRLFRSWEGIGDGCDGGSICTRHVYVATNDCPDPHESTIDDPTQGDHAACSSIRLLPGASVTGGDSATFSVW